MADELSGFLSSCMDELKDIRLNLRRELADTGLSIFAYEVDVRASPKSIIDTCLKELGKCDFYIGLFWKSLGDITVEEFNYARQAGKQVFVYIRNEGHDVEKALKKWLDENVRDPRCGVTYRYFVELRDLAKAVNADVIAWLRDEYREKTALLSYGEWGDYERDRLTKDVQRLRNSSREELPSGKPVDLLVYLVKAWLEANGCLQELYEKRTDEFCELIAVIPYRGSQTRVLVRVVDGVAEAGDVNEVWSCAQKLGVDGAWLVSHSRISNAAAAIANGKLSIRLFTLSDLIDEFTDFSGYIKRLKKEIRESGVLKGYVKVYSARDEYWDTTGQLVATESNIPLQDYLMTWLSDPSKEHVSLLAEYGSGKTWFALHFAHRLIQEYETRRLQGDFEYRLPIFIRLRDYSRTRQIEAMIQDFFHQKHRTGVQNLDAIKVLCKMRKIVFILDGFDEMTPRSSYPDVVRRFRELARIVVPGSKVLLTCRKEHFRYSFEARTVLRGRVESRTSLIVLDAPRFEVLRLMPFTPEQIKQALLQREVSEAQAHKILSNPDWRSLAARPLMIDLMLEAILNLGTVEQLTVPEVFAVAIRAKLERDIEDKRTFTTLSEKVFFMCELAAEMHKTGTTTLHYSKFPLRIRRYFGLNLTRNAEESLAYDLMGQTLLTRDYEGNYGFSHLSLLEFLAAFRWTAMLGVLDPAYTTLLSKETTNHQGDTCWTDWSTNVALRSACLSSFTQESFNVLSHELGHHPIRGNIVSMIVSLLHNDRDLVRRDLLQLIRATRGRKRTSAKVLGGNIATLLLAMSSLAMRNTCLDNTAMHEVAFGPADLTGASFRGADLQGSDLSHATGLGSASWKEANLVKSTLRSKDLPLVGEARCDIGTLVDNLLQDEAWLMELFGAIKKKAVVLADPSDLEDATHTGFAELLEYIRKQGNAEQRTISLQLRLLRRRIRTKRRRALLKFCEECEKWNQAVVLDRDLEEKLERQAIREYVEYQEEASHQVLLRYWLETALSLLDERKRNILELRSGLKDLHPRTLKDVSLKFNLTRERARVLEKKAYEEILTAVEDGRCMIPGPLAKYIDTAFQERLSDSEVTANADRLRRAICYFLSEHYDKCIPFDFPPF